MKGERREDGWMHEGREEGEKREMVMVGVDKEYYYRV